MGESIMNEDMIKIGFEGEKIIRNYLKTLNNCEFGQIDIIAKIGNDWYSFEIKKQEMFEKPPFDGHGLPPWQINFRIKMFNELGIIPILFIVDKITNIIYYQNMIILNKYTIKGESFLTKTKKRIIFPLDAFKILTNVPT